MIVPGEIVSYNEMCMEEGVNLQRGMNYQLGESYSIILMSQRKNAPYEDEISDDGKILIYEGHDVPRTKDVNNPKKYDQPMYNPSGSLTQNGMFFESAMKVKNKDESPEKVKVYEKIQSGIWAFNGIFNLIDSKQIKSQGRTVFKFWLELTDDLMIKNQSRNIEHTRIIPSSVKLKVWKRDEGKCVLCGKKDNLHYDHDIPFSKGGSSITSKNIRLLCARHNLSKSDNIE